MFTLFLYTKLCVFSAAPVQIRRPSQTGGVHGSQRGGRGRVHGQIKVCTDVVKAVHRVLTLLGSCVLLVCKCLLLPVYIGDGAVLASQCTSHCMCFVLFVFLQE